MKATFYVVFDAEIRGGRVARVRARRMTTTPPSINGGEIAVAFTADLPDSAFLRLMPQVDVEISEGFWTSQPVRVEVTEVPSEPE